MSDLYILVAMHAAVGAAQSGVRVIHEADRVRVEWPSASMVADIAIRIADATLKAKEGK